jgi:hypothetical protein
MGERPSCRIEHPNILWLVLASTAALQPILVSWALRPGLYRVRSIGGCESHRAKGATPP